MMDAVLAMLASVQVAAATLTVRQRELAGSPVRGSMMWCWRRPPASQVRTVVLEVARPPELIVTVWPGASAGAAWSSVILTCQPSLGGGPATARSPPRLTRTPTSRPDGDHGRAAVGGPGLGGGAEIELRPRGRVGSCRAGRVEPDVRQPGTGPARSGPTGLALGEFGEVAVVAGGDQRLADRGIDGTARSSSAARSASAISSANSSLIRVSRAGHCVQPRKL